MKKIKDKYGEVYDFDEVNNKVYKTLECHHEDGSITHERFEYYYDKTLFGEPY